MTNKGGQVVTVPPSMIERVREVCVREGITQRIFVSAAVQAELNKYEAEHAKRKKAIDAIYKMADEAEAAGQIEIADALRQQAQR